MKDVLLYILYNEGLEFENVECKTVEEAREAANKCTHYKPIFSIYTLHSVGKAKGIDWNLGPKKPVKKKDRHAGPWEDYEIEMLKEHLSEGHNIPRIAKAMGRTYNSVFVKAKKLKNDGL
jgi:hypothetical protein